MTEEILYEPARESDLAAIADLYQRSFPEALTAVFGRPRLPPAAVEDAFEALWQSEPAGVWVAREAGRVVGVVASVADLENWERRFFRRGLWPLVGRWLAGRYRGLGFEFVPRLAKAAWQYRHAPSAPKGKRPMAQVLTLMVEPSHRGRGIGRRLFERTIAYVRESGAASVRLEVDAAKAGPTHLYESLGFREIARIPSPRGPAIVMLRDT